MNEEFEIEREIDVKNLLKSVLKKWKQILTGAIVVCVLVCAYGYVKAKKAIKVDTDPKSSLTKEEIDDVNVAYATYTQASTTRDIIISKVRNSALSQIDPTSAVGLMSSYVIESDIDNIFAYYQSINVFSEEEQKEIIAACKFNEDTMNVNDLVSINGREQQVTSKVSVDSKLKTAITVSVYSNSEESCKLIASILEKHIADKSSATQSSYTKIDTVESIDTDFIANKQEELSDQIDSINNKISSLESPSYLSEEELPYYQYLISNSGKKAKKEMPVLEFNAKKYIAVGLVGGAFAVCVAYALLYILSGKVHETEEFNGYGIDSLGTIKNHNQEEIKMVVSNVVSYMKLHELKKLFIFTDCKENETQEVINNVVGILQKENISVEFGNPLVSNDDFNKIVSSNSILLLETAEKSLYENVVKINMLAKRQQIDISGSVVICE